MTTSRIALVTGAGSGVGRACAQALAKAGWHVALVGRRREALEETAGGDFERYLVLPLDVSDHKAVAAAFAALEAKWGRLDLLFNNAGSGTPAVTPDERGAACVPVLSAENAS